LVGSFRYHAALMRIARARIRPSAGCEQLVFTHDVEYPILPGPDALMPQSRPDFPASLAVKDPGVRIWRISRTKSTSDNRRGRRFAAARGCCCHWRAA
jgi:hypothetical protein